MTVLISPPHTDAVDAAFAKYFGRDETGSVSPLVGKSVRFLRGTVVEPVAAGSKPARVLRRPLRVIVRDVVAGWSSGADYVPAAVVWEGPGGRLMRAPIRDCEIQQEFEF